MKLGIALGRLNPAFFVEVTDEAERLGYESVWLPEHLIFTSTLSRSPHPGETHPPVPPETPIFDAFAYLSFLAGRTERLRLGTHVYNLGLRHPFVAARAVQTLDIVSGGRVEFGIGASWLEEEWVVAELDFATRGRRVDEALEVCKRLWTQPEISFHGEFFSFDGAVFEPKCVQQPYPPVLVGGESGAALRRAARAGDGWIGMNHDFESGAAQVNRLRELLQDEGRDPDAFQYCLGGPVETRDDVGRWADIGVTRLVISPWRRSREAVDGMRRFAETVGLELGEDYEPKAETLRAAGNAKLEERVRAGGRLKSRTQEDGSRRDAIAQDTSSAARSASVWTLLQPWPTVAATTTLLAVAIALGPVLGILPVALASVLWTAAVAYLVLEALVRRARSWSAWHWLFVAGVGVALLRASSLGLVQLLYDRPSLIWNVDARNYAMLAQGIARFSGVANTLDYSGARLEYHAGMSWIAGALNGTFGLSVNVGLFVLVLSVSWVIIGVGSYRLLKLFGAPTAASLVAVAVGINLPRAPLDLAEALVRGDRTTFLASDAWIPTSHILMLGGFALAVGITASCILLSSDSWWGTMLGATCLATLAAIKPQYLIGFGAFVAVAYLLRSRRRPEPIPWGRLALVAGMVVALTGVVALLNPQQNNSFTNVEIHLFEGIEKTLFPHDVHFITLYAFTGAVLTILVIAAVPRLRSSLQDRSMSRSRRGDLVAYALGATGSALLLSFAVTSTVVLVDGAPLARLRTIGWFRTRDWLDPNFDQALVPVSLIIVMVAVAMLTILVRRVRNPLRFAPAVVAVLLIVGPVPSTLYAMRHPTRWFSHLEWAEEPGLAELIRRVDTRKGVWLSSDMADSGDNFYRPLLMVSVLAASDAQFYMGNLTYINWTRGDAVDRVENLQRFFSTAWTAWHNRFLTTNDIHYVLVRDRCPAAWSHTEFPGSVVGRAGDWTLLEVGRGPSDDSEPRLWPEYRERPRYGRTGCLTAKAAKGQVGQSHAAHLG